MRILNRSVSVSVCACVLALLSGLTASGQTAAVDRLRADLTGKQGCLVEIGGLWASAEPAPHASIRIENRKASPSMPFSRPVDNVQLLIGETVQIASVGFASDSSSDIIRVEMKYTGYAASVSFAFGKGALGNMSEGEAVSSVESVFRPVIPQDSPREPALGPPTRIGPADPNSMPIMPAPSATGRTTHLTAYLAPTTTKGLALFEDPQKDFLYNEATWPPEQRSFCLAFERADYARRYYAAATPQQRREEELEEPDPDYIHRYWELVLSSGGGFARWHGTIRLGEVEEAGVRVEFVISCGQGERDTPRREVIFVSGPPNAPANAAAGPKAFSDPLVQALTRLGHGVAAEVTGGVFGSAAEPILTDFSVVSMLPGESAPR